MFECPISLPGPGYLLVWKFDPHNSSPGANWSGWTEYERTDSSGAMENLGGSAIFSTPYDSAAQFSGKMMTSACGYDHDRAFNDQYYDVKGSYTIDGNTAYWVESIADRMNSTAALQQRDDRANPDSQWGDPVDTATGVQTYNKTLISVQGALPIDFTIEYRTRTTPLPSTFGDGWGHNYQASLQVSAYNATVTWTPNRTEAFERTSSGTFVPQGDSTRAHTLTANPDGTHTLTLEDHSRYAFGTNGTLLSIWKHGKYIDLTYGAHGLSRITDRATGKYLEISYHYSVVETWDPVAVSDGTGRQATFGFLNSLLYWVTDANGSQTTFGYSWPGGRFEDPNWLGNPPPTSRVGQNLCSARDVISGAILFYNDYDDLGRITAQAGGINGGTYFAYDTATLGQIVTTVTKPDGFPNCFTRKYTHDSHLRLTKVIDENNNVTTYTYDNAGNRHTCTDPLNHTTAFGYDTKGRVTSITDPTNAVTQMHYDADGNLDRITDALSQAAVYTFDSNHNVLTAADAKTQTTTFTYNGDGQVMTVGYPGGGVDTFTYLNGVPATFTDRAGDLKTYQYDPAGHVASVTETPTTGATPLVTTFTYDGMDHMLTMTMPNCPDAQYGFITPMWMWYYDSLGHKTYEFDPLGHGTSFLYNQYGSLLQKIDPTWGFTQYEYNPSNQLTAVTTSYWKRTQIVRDPAGRVTAIIDPTNRATQFTYDAAGNRIATYNNAGTKVSEVAYDSRNLPTSVKDAYDVSDGAQFDVLQRLTSSTDRLGRTTTYTPDPIGQITSVQNPATLLTQQAWNANGFRTSFTNAANAATTLTPDPAGRLGVVQTAMGKQSVYNYNSPTTSTQPSSIVDANGSTTTLAYDNAKRLVSSTDDVSQVSRVYDIKGRLITVTEGAKTITREYDAMDRMTGFTDGDGNHVSYWYDPDGKLMTITYPGNFNVSYGYDAAGRMTAVYTWDGSRLLMTGYTYDAVGRLSTTNRANGTVETRTYDLNDRLLSITDTDVAGNIISSETLARDARGRITSETSAPVTWLASGTLASTFGYDLSDRLTSRSDTDGGGNSVMTHALSLDDASNITSSNMSPLLVPGFAHQNAAMTYDLDNRLSTFNGASTQFDNNGNMVAGPLGTGAAISAFAYDARNRLTSAGGMSFGYDAENRRTSVTSAAGTTHYVFNPQPTLDQVLAQIAPDGTVTHYVYGLGLISEHTGTDYRVYHFDSRGSTVAMSDASGMVVGRANYGAYGEIAQQDASLTTPFLFNGQFGVQTDASGLVYMRARYYSPAIKRFVNQDMVLGSVDEAASLNRFALVSGNPVSLIDPFGLFPLTLRVDTTIRPPNGHAGLKTSQAITLETTTGAMVERRYTGTTRVFFAWEVAGNSDFTAIADVGSRPDKLSVIAIGRSSSGVLPSALSIVYRINLDFDTQTGRARITGGTNGFPSYEVYVGGTKILDRQQRNFVDLLGDGGVPVDVEVDLDENGYVKRCQ